MKVFKEISVRTVTRAASKIDSAAIKNSDFNLSPVLPLKKVKTITEYLSAVIFRLDRRIVKNGQITPAAISRLIVYRERQCRDFFGIGNSE